jgi:nicotinate dehydrogenase subunit B
VSAEVRFTVNGETHEFTLEPERSVLSVLRDELGLTGAKPGCGEGECGACTVLVGSAAVRSCRLPALEVDGRAITTVEGLARGGRLHPVQRAFLEERAMQCGYCTPGMILGAVALLDQDPNPDEATIRASLEGNVCRCGTYPRIMRALRRATDLADAEDRDAGNGGDLEVPARGGIDAPDLPAPARGPWDLAAPGHRDYFDVLPDGMVVVLSPEQTPAGGWSTTSGCWIHVGADETVTAFTGKVDVGQDNRTSLSRLVAEELRVPMGHVSLVMGDTDLCPFDMGTFGSRSTPDAGEDLRASAAAALELLIASAADVWRVVPDALVAWGGRIAERRGSRSVTYGDLLRGVRRVEPVLDRRQTPPAGWETAGARGPSVRAPHVVIGIARFPSDVERPGMLHGCVLRPPAFGATLRVVDLEGARGMLDVTVVHEGDFVGVAAPDAKRARRALGAIRADWDLMPQPSERDLEAHLRASQTSVSGEGEWGAPFHHEAGDVDGTLEAADVRLDSTYTTAYIAHVPLETRVAVAEWSDAGRLTVWTGSQRPFGVRSELSAALDVPGSQVRVIVPDTGGGYGGKHSGEAAIEAARLARASGRPVRVMWTREEEFSWAYFRPAAVIDVRSGATAAGAITSWEFTNINSGDAGIMCPYDIPHQRIDFMLADSPVRQGSYRALAATANHFARESHIDELAKRLGADPLALRLRHLDDDRLADVFSAAAEHAGWGTPCGRGHGLGIAGGVEKDARVATCVQVRLGRGGRLEIVRVVTAFECGAVVDPEGLTNQIEGATVMGLGGALFEAIHFRDGVIDNASFGRYRVPRFSDVPPIEVVLLDRRDIPPAGAGETPIVAVAPALANAIHAATGRRIRSMPLVPDGVLP